MEAEVQIPPVQKTAKDSNHGRTDVWDEKGTVGV